MNIDSFLQPYRRFGVHLGLERIERLLSDLGNPHHRVPIIHVTGTNGKGSVCAYLSAILTEAGYKVGRYTSPHLVDWTERIYINEQPISTTDLEQILQQVTAAINPKLESPTLFEVITAAAWLYFARSAVDIAVMEVGLGGRLDATNVCDRPLVSIITSISLEHWQNLGPTVSDIAKEKAGILKQGCPAVIGNLPKEAKEVVASRIKQLNCPAVWVEPAERKGENWAKYSYPKFDPPQPPLDKGGRTKEFPVPLFVRGAEGGSSIEYPLPLLGDVQLINSAIAIASLRILQQQGWNIPETAIQNGMAKTRWSGRLQWTTWHNHSILIDGAHNPAAAQALRQYIDTLEKPITWVMGILATKDHKDIFEALLRPNDELYLVPVPDHTSADPEELANLAKTICPNLKHCQTFTDLFSALDTVFESKNNPETLVVLCGSLYLIGYFLKHQ